MTGLLYKGGGQHRGKGEAGFKVGGDAWMYTVETGRGVGGPGFWPGAVWVVVSFAKPGLVLEPELPADDASLVVFQVNEIYHDESLGAHINVVLVRIVLLSYGKVSECPSRWAAPARHRPPLKVFASPKPPVSPSRLPCASCQTQETCQSTQLSSSPFTLAPCFTCRFCYYSGVVRLTHQEVTDMEKMVIPHRSCHAGPLGKHQVWLVGRRREDRAPL